MLLPWLWTGAFLTAACFTDAGSSLRGAVEALQRRQRSHSRGPTVPLQDYDALYEFIPPGYSESDYPVDVEDIEEALSPKYMVKLLDENDRPPKNYEYKIIKKKNSFSEESNGAKKESAFRERTHHSDNDRLRDLFGRDPDEKNEKMQARAENDADYAFLLGELWSKYKNQKAENPEPGTEGIVKLYKEKVVKKRYSDNWGPIAFKKKRSSDSNIDPPVQPDYEAEKKPMITDHGYNSYDVNDNDDIDDWREEYAIAFQPLNEEPASKLDEEDQYNINNEKNRFPVTKRSGGDINYQKKRFVLGKNKQNRAKTFRSSAGTDPKIIKDLSKIFGDVDVIKKQVKRNVNSEDSSHEVKPPQIMMQHLNGTHDRNLTNHDDNSHEHHGHSLHHPGISGEEVENVHDHSHHDHDKPKTIKKKSIDWSDYFGIDKRAKKFANSLTQDLLRKQYFDTFNKEVIYPLNSFRKHNFAKKNYMQPIPNEETEFQLDARALSIRDEKRNMAADANSKLDNIDKKLKNMEGIMVDEALHYSEMGEELDSKEEQEMKEKLLSRLAAAYSLEKMRKALKEFKQSLQTQRTESTAQPVPLPTDESKAKRVAVKKELLNNEIPFSNKHDKNEDFEDEQGAGHYLNGKIDQPLSEGYMGGSGRHRIPVVSTASAPGSCPVLTKIVQRCRGVDLLAGDRGQLFLPLCSLHQICYLCGEAPPTTCDLVFLSEADTTCEGDMSCQRSARLALMALKELHDNLADEMDGECETSPCLPATLKLNIGWQRALQR